MRNRIIILQISDLHRSNKQYVSNTALISSLERDIIRVKEEQSFSEVDILVVSGDIVNGVRGKLSSELPELKRQYEEATELLSGLADKFLNGDRNKVIIVPGNHDVSWYHSRTSMQEVAEPSTPDERLQIKREYQQLMMRPNSRVRWSWNTFNFLNIHDYDLYLERFAQFAEFYENFYLGKRKYNLDPSRQYDVFDYPNLNLTIVGFNSCYNNDHCRMVGKIHSDCIANALTVLREDKYKGRTRAAVWHHNLYGLPTDNNFMDSDFVQNLLEEQFFIAFHGHQHKNDVLNQRFVTNLNNKIVIISAGSLCAGSVELPPGESRQYNIIDIDFPNKKAIVRVRAATNPVGEIPIWRPQDAYREELSISVNIENKKDPIENIRLMDNVISLIKTSQYNQALEILKDLDVKETYVRSLLIECYNHLDDLENLVSVIGAPQTSAEAVFFMNALWEFDRERLRKLLKNADFYFNDPVFIEQRESYARRLG